MTDRDLTLRGKCDAISAVYTLYPASYTMASGPERPEDERPFTMSIHDLDTDATLASATGASWDECVAQLQAKARADNQGAADSFRLTA